MPQSLSKLYLHLVFSTKERKGLIPKEKKEELHGYIAGILANHNCHAVAINSMPDHIHLLFNLSRTITVAKIVEQVKSSSTHWLNDQGIRWERWQAGYGVFSVSESQLGIVSNYINQQEKHHKTISFQDELRQLFYKHRIEFDERYVWD